MYITPTSVYRWPVVHGTGPDPSKIKVSGNDVDAKNR
jgi:hypothetical protein